MSRKLTEDHRKKISKSLKGRKFTEEHKEKLREAQARLQKIASATYLPDLYEQF